MLLLRKQASAYACPRGIADRHAAVRFFGGLGADDWRMETVDRNGWSSQKTSVLTTLWLQDCKLLCRCDGVCGGYGIMSTSKRLLAGLTVKVRPLVDGSRYFSGMFGWLCGFGIGRIGPNGNSARGGRIAT
jgi:hypothetical protein